MTNSTDWLYENLVSDENGMVKIPKERYDQMKNALFNISVLGYLGSSDPDCTQCNEIDEAFQYAKSLCRSSLGLKNRINKTSNKDDILNMVKDLGLDGTAFGRIIMDVSKDEK